MEPPIQTEYFLSGGAMIWRGEGGRWRRVRLKDEGKGRSMVTGWTDGGMVNQWMVD